MKCLRSSKKNNGPGSTTHKNACICMCHIFMYVYVCMYVVCMYSTYIYANAHTQRTHMLYINIHTSIRKHMHICICMYACIYVCIHIHVYTYIYMCIHTCYDYFLREGERKCRKVEEVEDPTQSFP